MNGALSKAIHACSCEKALLIDVFGSLRACSECSLSWLCFPSDFRGTIGGDL